MIGQLQQLDPQILQNTQLDLLVKKTENTNSNLILRVH